MHLPVRRRLALLASVLAFSLLSCGREVTGPDGGIRFGSRVAALAIAPEMPSLLSVIDGAGDVVPFERVRVVLRASDGAVAKDTVVAFPSGADSVALSLLLPLPFSAADSGLPLSLTMAYINAGGDTVFRGGPNVVVARPVGTPGASTPVQVPITYSGPGNDATRVAITPDVGNAISGTTTAFGATAFNAQDQAIANTPFVFFTLDSARAQVNPVTGVATWLASRGTARIVAALPSGSRADTATYTVALPASRLELASGGAQSAPLGTLLPDSIAVQTLAADGVPVSGVIVTFAVASGGGSLSVTTDTSDANGLAATRWTLGTTLGAQGITATASGLTGSPLAIAATATIGAATRLEISAPGVGTAGSVLAPAVTVIARDAFGNIVPTFTDSISIGVAGANPPTLGGTRTRAAVGGLASFGDLRIDAPGSFALVASSGSLQPDTSTAIAIAVGAAAQLAVISGEAQTGTVGTVLAQPVVVEVRDAVGNPRSGTSVTFDVTSGGGSLSTVTAISDGNGRVSTTWTLGAGTGTQTLSASLTDTPAVTVPITATAVAAEPTQVVITASPDTVVAGALFAVVAEVRDGSGNLVSSYGGNVSIALNAGPVVTTLGGTTTVIAVGGVATFTGLSVTAAGAGFDLVATAVTENLTSAPSVPFTVRAAGAAQFFIASGVDQVGPVGAPFPAPLRVRVLDVYDNPLVGHPTYWATGGVVTLAQDTVLTDANGFADNTATFGTVVGPQSAGPFVTTAGNGSLLIFTHTVTAAAATQLVVTQQPPDTVQAGESFTVVVEARDPFGNRDAAYADSATIGLLNGSVGATLGGTTVRQPIAGVFTFSGLTLERSGTFDFSVSAPGLVTATTEGVRVNAGAAATLAKAEPAGDLQTIAVGSTSAPLRVLVTDALGNPVQGAAVAWSVSAGAGSVDAPTSLTDADGIATTTYNAPAAPGAASVVAEVAGLTGSPQSFSLTVTPGPATTLVVLQAASGAVVSEILTPPFIVGARDVFGNPTATPDSVIAEIASGPVGGTLGGTLRRQTTGGDATFGDLTLSLPGTYTLRFTSPTIADSAEVPGITITAGVPATIAAVGGDAQSGAVNTTLPTPLTVEVRDALGNVVPDASVTFSVSTGNATLTVNPVLTDATGRASTELVLGTVTGPVAVTATVDALAPVFFSATIVAGTAVTPNELVAPAGGTAGTALGSFSYAVYDQFGNIADGYTGTAFVTLDPINGAQPTPVIASGDTVAVVNGIATWDALVVTSAGQYRIVADFGPTLGTFVSDPITITAAGPSALLAVGGDAQSAPVGTALANPITVRVTDVYGNPVSGVSINFGVITGSASLGGSIVPTDTLGESSVSVLLGTTAGPVTIGAFAAGLTPDSLVFTATALTGTPSAIVLVAGDAQTTAAGTAATDSVRVRVADGFGNPVVGATVTFTTAADLAFSDTTVTTDAAGEAATQVIAGGTLGAQAFSATSPPATALALTLTVEAGAPARVAIVAEPTSGAAGAALAPLNVEVQDAFGNLVPGAANAINVTLDASVTSAALLGTLTREASGGAASFDNLQLNFAAPYRLVANAVGLTPDTTAIFTVVAGAPSVMNIVSGDAQTATVGTALANPLVVELRDAFANPVSGVPVTWGVADGLSVVDSTSYVTDALGRSQMGVTMATTAETATIVAAFGGLNASFSATGLPGAASALTAVTGDGQTQFATLPLDAPLVVRVTDGFGNPISGDSVFFTVATGSGTLENGFGVDTVVTDANGNAQITWVLGVTLGAQTVEASTLVLGPVTFTATATELLGNAIWTGAVSTAWDDASNWRSLAVPTVTDSVFIPTGLSLYPALTAPQTVARLTVADGAALALNEQVLTVNGRVVVPTAGAVTAGPLGGLFASGGDSTTIVGRLPRLVITTGVYVTDGDVVVDDGLFVQGGGRLRLALGDSLDVGGVLQTASGGSIVQEAGSAASVGGDLALLSGSNRFDGGRLHLRGNLDVNASAPADAFVAASAHELILRGTVTQTLSLATADTSLSTTCASSCLGTLRANKAAGEGNVQFLTNAKALGAFDIQAPGLSAAEQYLVAGAFSTVRGELTDIRKFAFVGGFDQGPSFVVDTLVAWGSGTVLGQGVPIPLVIAGDYTMVQAYDAAIRVDAGTLDVDGAAARVIGDFGTAGTGRLRMTDAGDTLRIEGNASFAGASSAGDLTAGLINLTGNLSVATTGAFVADSAHAVFMTGATPTLAMADTTASRIGTLLTDGVTSVTLNGPGVRAAGDVRLAGSSTILGGTASHLTIGGRLVDPAGGRIGVPTVVLTGTNALETPVIGATQVILRGSLTLAADLQVDATLRVESGGQLVPNAWTLLVNDTLVTSGTGAVQMTLADDSIAVGGDALFNGGQSVMSAGRLIVGGRFDVGSAQGFQGSQAHVTELNGSANQQLGFSFPGFGVNQSYFGTLALAKPTGTVLASTAIFVSGWLLATDEAQSWTGVGALTPLTLNSADLLELNLVNQPVTVIDGSPLLDLNGLRFTGMDAGLTQLAIRRAGGAYTVALPVFDTLAVSPTYLALEDTDPLDSDTLRVTMSNAQPLYHGGLISLVGGAQLLGWNEGPAFIWTGAADITWTNPANWSDGIVPTATSTAVVPAGATSSPTLSGPVTLRGLVVESPSQAVNVGANTLTLTDSLATVIAGSSVTCTSGGALVVATADTARARGSVSCPLTVTGGTLVTSGQLVSSRPVAARDSGTFAIRHTFETNGFGFEGNLETSENGRIIMDVAGVQAFVSGAVVFSGGTSLLNAGTLNVEGGIQQSVTTASVLGQPTHTTVLRGTGGSVLGFDTFGTTSLGSIVVEPGAVHAINSAMTANGSLTLAAGATLELYASVAVNGDVNAASGSLSCPDGGALILGGSGARSLSGLLDLCDVAISAGEYALAPAGSVTMETLSITGSGSLDAAGTPLVVNSAFQTAGDGVLRMQLAEDTVVVRGNAVFNGGSTAGLLTAGTLLVEGNIVQFTPTSLAAFAPSGTHHTVVGDSTISVGLLDFPSSVVQLISPDSSAFNRFTLAGGWVNVPAAPIIARQSVVLRDGTRLTGAGVVADSGFTQALTASLNVDLLSVAGPVSFGADFLIDTVVYRGPEPGGVSQEVPSTNGASQLPYERVIVAGPNVRFTEPSQPYSLARLEIVSGSLTVADNVVIGNAESDLSISGSGQLFLPGGAPTLTFDSVTVSTSATVAPNAGMLTFRSFIQEGAANWQPTGSFGATKTGTGTIKMADETGAVFFNHLVFEASSATTLGSDLRVQGNLGRDEFTPGSVVIASDTLDLQPRVLVAAGTLGFPAGVGSTFMRNVRLSIAENLFGEASALRVNGLRFERMDPNDPNPVLLTRHTGPANVTWSNIVFDTPIGTNLFFQWDAVADGSITFAGAFPNIGCFATTCTSGQFVPDGTAPETIWLGETSDDWADPSNWSNGVPTSSMRAVVAANGFQPVQLSTNTSVGSLSVTGLAELSIGLGDTLIVAGDVNVLGTVTGSDYTSVLRMQTGGLGATLSASGRIRVPLLITEGIFGNAGRVVVDGRVNLDTLPSGFNGFRHGLYLRAGILDLNGGTLESFGGVRVGGTGILEMNQPTDSVFAQWNVVFAGDNTTGYLTDGTIVANSGPFYQADSTSALSFVATGSHRVIFAGADNDISVEFASPSRTGSRFNRVAFNKGAPRSVNFEAGIFPADTVFAQELIGATGDVFVFGGSLVVMGPVSGTYTGTWNMVDVGSVILEGVDPATCGGLSIPVSGNNGQFTPTTCHTAPFLFTQASGTFTETLNAVFALDDNNVWAVGNNGAIHYLDDALTPTAPWVAQSSGTSVPLTGVHGVQNNFVVAVGLFGTILHWNGDSWIAQASPTSSNLRAVHMYSTTQGFAVGDNGTILRWDGSAWSEVASLISTDFYGLDDSDGVLGVPLRAVGTLGVIAYSDFADWTAETNSDPTDLYDTWQNPQSTQRWAVGRNGTVRWSGGAFGGGWSAADSPNTADLHSIDGTDFETFVVGEGGIIIRRFQNRFLAQPTPTSQTLWGVTITPGNVVFAVGANGTVLRGAGPG